LQNICSVIVIYTDPLYTIFIHMCLPVDLGFCMTPHWGLALSGPCVNGWCLFICICIWCINNIVSAYSIGLTNAWRALWSLLSLLKLYSIYVLLVSWIIEMQKFLALSSSYLVLGRQTIDLQLQHPALILVLRGFSIATFVRNVWLKCSNFKKKYSSNYQMLEKATQ